MTSILAVQKAAGFQSGLLTASRAARDGYCGDRPDLGERRVSSPAEASRDLLKMSF
jgi:hypothetical protein